jgi:hypothetical protein
MKKVIDRYFSVYQVCIYIGSLISLAMNWGLIPYWRKFTFYEVLIPVLIPWLAYGLTWLCAFFYGMLCGLMEDDDI